MKSRIKDVLQDDRARKIIHSHLPNILNNPNIKYAIIFNPKIKSALKYRNKVNIDGSIIDSILEEILALD